ncbi:MAG: DUF3330 domain-containing protein [Gammaproteobacteria bacterium]|nr:DUF3330 domain-containing protein [Gammaproteobacteria bacterium]
MQPKTATNQGGMLSCEVCLKEIPASAAKSVEAEDYVHYFCGADCFDRWLKKEGNSVKMVKD